MRRSGQRTQQRSDRPRRPCSALFREFFEDTGDGVARLPEEMQLLDRRVGAGLGDQPEVPGPDAERVVQPLRTTLVGPTQGGDLARHPVNLFRSMWPDHVVAYSGLEPAVAMLCQQAGPEWHPRQPPPLPAPQLEALHGNEPMDVALLQQIRHQSRLLVHYGHGTSLGWLIAQVCLALAGSQIVIAVKRREEARLLASDLQGRGIKAQLLTTDNDGPPETARVTVGMPRSLSYAVSDLGESDIFIASDAIEIQEVYGRWAVRDAHPARIIGFLPEQLRVSPYEQDIVHCLFGFAAMSVPKHGCRTRAVQTVLCRVQGGLPLPQRLTDYQLRERAIERNPIRNRRIARLATQLAAGELAAAQADLGLGPGTDLPESFAGATRAAIVVEAIDHALQLLPRLPTWGLVSAPINMAGLSHRDRQLLVARQRRDKGNVVCTLAGLGALALNEIDVLLRADGGPGGLPELDLLSAAQPAPLLLIDVADRHHPRLRRWRRQRCRAYRGLGWYPLGADPVEERVKDFLARRPEVAQ